jgi:hypothetical protein
MHTEFNPTETALLQGTVFKKNTGSYLVQSDERVYTCAISNRLRKELVYPIADPSSLPHRVWRLKTSAPSTPSRLATRCCSRTAAGSLG